MNGKKSYAGGGAAWPVVAIIAAIIIAVILFGGKTIPAPLSYVICLSPLVFVVFVAFLRGANR